MTNPKVICFLLAFVFAVATAAFYVYVNRERIYEHMTDWLCYMICKDLHERNISIEPATNWIHRRAIKYAIRNNKDAIFITEG